MALETSNRIMATLCDEEGAVTVDWVVLTASIVSLGFLVGNMIWSETDNAAIGVADFLDSQNVISTFAARN